MALCDIDPCYLVEYLLGNIDHLIPTLRNPPETVTTPVSIVVDCDYDIHHPEQYYSSSSSADFTEDFEPGNEDNEFGVVESDTDTPQHTTDTSKFWQFTNNI